jgi:hypothetical protein
MFANVCPFLMLSAIEFPLKPDSHFTATSCVVSCQQIEFTSTCGRLLLVNDIPRYQDLFMKVLHTKLYTQYSYTII